MISVCEHFPACFTVVRFITSMASHIKLRLSVKLLPHVLQEYGFSPVCTALYLLSADEADNLFLQVLQFYSVPHLRGFWCGPTPYSKTFPTCFTWIWFFTCVSFHMGQEITIFTKMFPTSFTMIWFLICVDSSWWTFSYRLFHKCHMSQSFYQYQCYTGSDST